MEYRLQNATFSGGKEMVLTMQGDLTHRDFDGFLDLTERMAESGVQRVKLDLGGLESIDSSGVGMLLMAFDVARRRRIDMTIHNARGQTMTAVVRSPLNAVLTLS